MSNLKKTLDVKKLTYIAILTAIVVVLQFIPIRIGAFEYAFAVPVIVIGAALCGIGVGTWLGFVFGVVVLMLPGTAAFLTFSPFGTIVTVLVKGILAGLAASLVYKLLQKYNRYIAVFVSAVAATFANTLTFLLGSVIFFGEDIKYVISGLIGLNFILELVMNIVLVPVAYRIINIKRK